MLQRVFVTKLLLFLARSFVRLDFTSSHSSTIRRTCVAPRAQTCDQMAAASQSEPLQLSMGKGHAHGNQHIPSSPVGRWVQALLCSCLSLEHARCNTSFMQNSATGQLVYSFFLLLFIRHENRMAHFFSSSSGRLLEYYKISYLDLHDIPLRSLCLSCIW